VPYLCEFRFQPTRPLPEDFLDTVSLLATALRRNGHVLGEPVLGWEGHELRLLGSVPHPESLAPAYRSEYVQIWLTKLASWCEHTPSCEIRTHDEAPSHLGSLEDLPSLYIHSYENTVLRCGPDGLGVPLYLLPLHPDERERLNNWQRQYDWVASLEASCGCLEFEAYREMADQHSWLTRQGRAWAQRIEEVTQLPTYYYLVHHHGDANPRPCPGCGQEWQVEGEGLGLDSFPFRCDACRLLSCDASNHPGDVRSVFGRWSLGGMCSPGD
jgi:predicted  nucleic acid-binding Zn ribbon protein